MGRRPQELIERALYEAQGLLTGPAIQARCLECPAVAPIPRQRAETGGSWPLRLFVALAR